MPRTDQPARARFADLRMPSSAEVSGFNTAILCQSPWSIRDVTHCRV
jgi:hypothetical protein